MNSREEKKESKFADFLCVKDHIFDGRVHYKKGEKYKGHKLTPHSYKITGEYDLSIYFISKKLPWKHECFEEVEGVIE